MELEATWPPPPPSLPYSGSSPCNEDVQQQHSRDMAYAPHFHDENEDILGAISFSVITAGSHISPLGSEASVASVSSTSSYRRRRASAAVAAAADALFAQAPQDEQRRGSTGSIQHSQHDKTAMQLHISARSSPRGCHSRQRSISSLSEPRVQWGQGVTPVSEYNPCTAQEDRGEARSRTASRINSMEDHVLPEEGHSDTGLTFSAPLHLEPQLLASLREGGGGGENNPSARSGGQDLEGLSGATGLTPFPGGAGRDSGRFSSQVSRQSGHLVDESDRLSRTSSRSHDWTRGGEEPCVQVDLEMEQRMVGRVTVSQCNSRRGSLGSIASSLAEEEGRRRMPSRPRSASGRASRGGGYDDAATHYSQSHFSQRTSSRASEGLRQEEEAGYGLGLEVPPSPRSLRASHTSTPSRRASAKAAQEQQAMGAHWGTGPTAAGDVASAHRLSYSHVATEAGGLHSLDQPGQQPRHSLQAAGRGSFTSAAMGPSTSIMHSRAASLEAHQGARGGGRTEMELEMEMGQHAMPLSPPSERASTLASKLWPSLHDHEPGVGPAHRGGREAASQAPQPSQEEEEEEAQTPWPPHSRSVSRSVSRASSISARLPLGPSHEEALTPYPPPSQHTSQASSRSLRRSPTPEQRPVPVAVAPRGREQTERTGRGESEREDRDALSNVTPPQPRRRAASSLSSSSSVGSYYRPAVVGREGGRGPPVAYGPQGGVRGSVGRSSSFSSMLLHPHARTSDDVQAKPSAVHVDIPVAHPKADIWQDNGMGEDGAWDTPGNSNGGRRRSRETVTHDGGARTHHVRLSNSTAPQMARAVGRRRDRDKAEEGEAEEKVLGLVQELYREVDTLRQDMRQVGQSSEAGMQALRAQGDERYAQLQGQLSECVAHLRDLRAHPLQEHHHQHVHHAPPSPSAHAPPHSPSHSNSNPHTYAHHPMHPHQQQPQQQEQHQEGVEVGPSEDHARVQAPLPSYTPRQHHVPSSAFSFGSLPTAPVSAPRAHANADPTVTGGTAGFGNGPGDFPVFGFGGRGFNGFGNGPQGLFGGFGFEGGFGQADTGHRVRGAGGLFAPPPTASQPPHPAAERGFYVPPPQPQPQPQQYQQRPLLQLSPDRQALLVQFLDQLAQRRQRQQDKLFEADLLQSLDVEDLPRRRSYSEARGPDSWRGYGSRREGEGVEALRGEVDRVRDKCEGNGEALAAARLELLQLEERMAAGERENRQRFESVRRALKLFGDTLRVDLPPHFLSTSGLMSAPYPSSHSYNYRSRYGTQSWHPSP